MLFDKEHIKLTVVDKTVSQLMMVIVLKWLLIIKVLKKLLMVKLLNDFWI
jgi:hypothetical protein